MDDPIFVKILIVGDSSVGKTSIIQRFTKKPFLPNQPPTVGCDFATQVFKTSNGISMKIQLWDIAGQERYHALSKLYVRGAKGCVIVTDITSQDCITSGLKWKQNILDQLDENEEMPIILVLNKIDLIEKNNLSSFLNENDLKNIVIENNFVDFVKTSAKEDLNINNIFEKLIQEINKREDLIRKIDEFEDSKLLNFVEAHQEKVHKKCEC